MVSHSPGDIAAVAVLRPTAFCLEAKEGSGAVDVHDAEIVEVPAGASGRTFSLRTSAHAQIALGARPFAIHQRSTCMTALQWQCHLANHVPHSGIQLLAAELATISLNMVTHHCVSAADYQVQLPPPQPLPPPLEQWRPGVLRQQGRRPEMLTLLAAAPAQPQNASTASAGDTAAALAGVLRALHAGEALVYCRASILLMCQGIIHLACNVIAFMSVQDMPAYGMST